MKVGWKLSYGHNYFCLCLEATGVSRARGTGWLVGAHARLLASLSQLPAGGFAAGSWNAEVANAVWSRARNWTLISGGWGAVMNVGDGKVLIRVCLLPENLGVITVSPRLEDEPPGRWTMQRSAYLQYLLRPAQLPLSLPVFVCAVFQSSYFCCEGG